MSNLGRDWSWVTAHGTVLLTAAGAVLVALVLLAVWQVARRGSLDGLLRGIAMPMVLAFEAQGLFVLIRWLHAPRDLAFVLCGFAAASVLAFAAAAHKHFRKHGNLGPNGRVMWYVAVPMGIAVAASAGSLAGAMLRIILSLLSVALFRAPYLPEEPEGREREEGSWQWTPRRIAVRLGLLAPGATDLTSVHAERQIRLLTSHAAGYHRGVKVLRRWHGWCFERLALAADDDMISEAARRVHRVHTGLASTAPVPTVTGTAGPSPVPMAMASEVPHAILMAGTAALPPAIPTADPAGLPVATPIGDPVEVPVADTPHEPRGDTPDDADPQVPGPTSGDPASTPFEALGRPSAMNRVRRKGAGNATDDEVKAAIRQMGMDGSKVTVYRIGKELHGSKGGISDNRARRLLEEVQAETSDRTVVAIGSRRTAEQ